MTDFLKRYKSGAWALFMVMFGYMIISLLRLPEPFLWALRLGVIAVVIKNLNKSLLDRRSIQILTLFLCWLLFEVIRAVLLAEGYWMLKNVINQGLLAIFYFVIIIAANTNVVQDYFAIYWKFLIPMVVLSVITYGSPIHYDYVPFSVLVLFFGVVPRNKSLLLICVLVFYFFTIGQRNDMAKIFFSSIIGLSIAYLMVPKWIFKIGSFFFLVLPFMLLWLGTTGVFNVFKMDDYIKGDYSQQITTSNGVEDDNLKADTRTFIYRNVFYTIAKYDAWILGRSPAFGDEGVQGSWGKDSATGIVGRYGNEVGVMDILLWYGVIGVAIYFLVFVRASYLAIYRSRSKYAKGVGLYMSFLWTWSFIWEKPMVETFFMMDLILMGLCFSKPFRMMTDQDIKYWIKGVFAVRRKRRLIKA
jgi:hypothetical protein